MHWKLVRSRSKQEDYDNNWPMIQRVLKKDRRTSAEKVSEEIKKQLNISPNAQSVRNRVHEIGMFGRVIRKKPYVNKANRSKRFKFAKEML